MKADEFTLHSACKAADVLQLVLRSRRHKKVYLGEEVWVPGRLDEALKLPQIIKHLKSRTTAKRSKGLLAFQELWPTLSTTTQTTVLTEIGWYDTQKASWEDKRSNRKPNLDED